MNVAMEGAVKLMDTLNGKRPTLPIGDDSVLVEIVERLSYANLREFAGDVSVRGARSYIRYLAALWPDASMNELVDRVYTVVSNKELLPVDIRNILEGAAIGHKKFSEQDVALVLKGQMLSDASRRTREVPIQVIQLIGKCLREGMTLRSTATACRCSFDTVEAVDRMLGLRQAYDDRVFDAAVNAVRDNVSIRTFAARHNVSRSYVQRLFVKARQVLTEIGEVPA